MRPDFNPDGSRFIRGSNLLGRVQALLNLRPIHDVPPGRDVLRPAVLILQVICMLPYVQAHDGVEALHDGTVLVCGRYNLDAAALLDQPGPAGSEPAGGGGVEFFLELIQAAEGAVDGLRDVSAG